MLAGRTRTRATLLLGGILIVAASLYLGWFFPLAGAGLFIGASMLLLQWAPIHQELLHRLDRPTTRFPDSVAADAAPPAIRRFLVSFGRIVLTKPLLTTVVVLIVLLFGLELRYHAAIDERNEIATQLSASLAANDDLQTELDSQHADLVAARDDARSAKDELAAFDGVIAPERARREAEALKEKEAAAAREAKRLEELQREADAKRQAEEAAAAAEARTSEIARLREAVAGARTAISDSAASFDELAFEPNLGPGSLSWIPGIVEHMGFLGLCKDLTNDDARDACDVIDSYQAMDDMRQAYADFFIGRVSYGLVLEKQREASAAVAAWERKVSRLR